MNKTKFAAAAVVAASTLAACGSSFACGAGKVLFEDKLQAPSQNWGVSDFGKEAAFSKNGLTLKLPPDRTWAVTNQTAAYKDYELCVNAAIQDSAGDTGQSAFTVTFWKLDDNNKYSLYISSYGIYSVQRTQYGTLLPPVPWTKTAAIK